MPRRLRLERAGSWYHITARGNERRCIYRKDADREHFLDLLAEAVERFRIRLIAYVLMLNHYHLVLNTTEPNLGRTMHWLNTSYAVWFNGRYRRSGHLFQGRYDSVGVEPRSWGLGVTRYVHLNPVRLERLGLDKATQRRERRGEGRAPSMELVRARLAVLRDYRWSSYRAYVGWEKPPAWLSCQDALCLGGGNPRDWQRRYRESVECQVRAGTLHLPWAAFAHGGLLGTCQFVFEHLKRLTDKRRAEPVRVDDRKRPSFRAIIRATEQVVGRSWQEFRDEHGHWGRDLALYVGQKQGGLTLRELAEAVEVKSPKAVSMAIKRYRQRHASVKEVRKVQAKVEASLKRAC